MIAYVHGYSGESCSACRKTSNVETGGSGWWCPCGHFNLLCWSGMKNMPHARPDYGPADAEIRAGTAPGEKVNL
jgi:hypothetical protein